MSLYLLTRHDQRRIVSEVLCIMLMCIGRVGSSVEVLEESFEIWVEVKFGGFEVVVSHFGKLINRKRW
jgi:hypothetical protein